MTTVDFQTLHPQIVGQWQAIEQASTTERRLLVLELTQVLAEWEAAQEGSLENIQNLRLMGHWRALGDIVGARLQAILVQLGENKPVLRERLMKVGSEVGAAEAELQSLNTEVEALSAELAAGEARLTALRQAQDVLRQQLESLHRLRQLEMEVEQTKAGVDELKAQLQSGYDPGGALTQLVTLSKMLLGYYQAYLAADRDIAHHLLSSEPNNSQSPTLSRMLQVPERLMALERDLKDIDRVLAERLQEQDAWDREVKARA